MRRMSPSEAAALFLSEMPEDERIDACRKAMLSIRNPGHYQGLLTASHEIARHADCLERQLKLAASRDGFCQPDTSGHLPRGGHKAAPRGPLTLLFGGIK